MTFDDMINPFPHTDVSDNSAADDFWNKAHNEQFLLLPHSFQLNDLTLVCGDFHVFKEVCYKFVICGKGLTLSHIQQFCSRRRWKHLRKSSDNPFNLNERTIIE